MKKLITTSISNTVGFPVKSGTLDFLQLAYQEALTAISKNIIGSLGYSTSTVYILYGCVNSGSGSSYIISAGAVFYNGEVYLVPAATFTVSGGDVAIATLVTLQYSTNADPVVFTDGSSKSVHNIRQVVITDGSTGSGISDFSNFKETQIVLSNEQVATLPSSYVVDFKRDKAVFFAAAPNDCTITFSLTGAVPGCVIRLKWTFGASRTLTITGGAGQAIIADGGDLGSVGGNTNLLYILYVGKNEAGDDEISYTIKQV